MRHIDEVFHTEGATVIIQSFIHPFLCSINNYCRLTDIENRLVVAKGGGGRVDWEFGVRRYKLLFTRWINKVLLYSRGNYIQYPMISHNGKECIHKLNRFAVQHKLTQHYKSTMCQ